MTRKVDGLIPGDIGPLFDDDRELLYQCAAEAHGVDINGTHFLLATDALHLRFLQLLPLSALASQTTQTKTGAPVPCTGHLTVA
jgi:hypothetical protein